MIGRPLQRLRAWLGPAGAGIAEARPTTLWSASEHLIIERYADTGRAHPRWRAAVLGLVLAASLAAAGYLLARPPVPRSSCPNVVPRGLVIIRISGHDRGCVLRRAIRAPQTR